MNATVANRPAPRTRSARTTATRRISEAVQRGVDVALQPIVDLTSGEIVGVEALARFSDGRSPDKWFTEATSLGLGAALELAAVQGALARINELPGKASLSVNVSASTACSPALSKTLAAAPPGRVVLEITEHVPVTDYPALATALSALRSRGIRVAVDDAGAGFASMQHVLRLHPDVVKLDASLVRGIDSEPSHRAMVSALVSFAHATGCSLVAEGIETASELAVARALGVACAQGFHLGVPDAAGPARWQVPLPRKPRRSVASSVKGAGRFGRPAALFAAAALSWPGIVAVAGFEGPRTGGQAERPPVAARQDSGVSGMSETAEQPAAASIPSSKPTVARKVEETVPTARPSPSRAAPPTPKPKKTPVKNVVGEVGDLTQTVTGTVRDLLTGLLSPEPAPTPKQGGGGLLGGLLGG